ncbi:uncharacterized protein RBU57_004561 [Macrochelys suwanniensis]
MPLQPQPVQDHPAKSFSLAPAPSTPVPQGPSSFVAVGSPVRTEVELTLSSIPDTVSAARDLIAMTDPAPHQPSVPPMRIVPSRGKPAMLCQVPHTGAGRRRSRSRSRSQSRSRRRSQSWHRSQSRHRSSSRRRSYLWRCSRSTSRHGRHYYGSRHRSRSRGRLKHRSPDNQSRRRSPRHSLTRSRLGSPYRDNHQYRSRSRYQSRSRHRSPSPRRSMAPRSGLQGYSTPPWPSRSVSRSSRAGSGYYMDQGHGMEGPSRWQGDMQDPAQGPQQWPFWTPMAYHQTQGAPSRASQSAHLEPRVPEATVSCPLLEDPETAAHPSAEAPVPEAEDLEPGELLQQDLPQDPLVPGLSSSSSPDEAVARASSSGPPPIDLQDHQDLLRRLALNMNLQERHGQQAPAPKSKEARHLDLFGRKIYSGGGLQLRAANQQALLSRYNYNTWNSMQKFREFVPQESRQEYSALIEEGKKVARTSLQASLDIAYSAARTLASGVAMRRISWLQSSNLPPEVQYTIQDLPFDGQVVFSEKTDSRLQTLRRIQVFPYLDDWLIRGSSSSQVQSQVQIALTMFNRLGLLLNVKRPLWNQPKGYTS